MTEKHASMATEIRLLPVRAAEIPRRDDEVDFNRLYELYGRRVYSWCAYMSGSMEEAEDLTQDSFLQLYRSIDTFRGESGFATWLYRVVTNVVQGRFRKKTVPTISLESVTVPLENDGTSSTTFEPPDFPASDPIDRLSLEELMAELPSVYRKILILHDVRGYRHVEIAQMLAMPIGTTKAYLHRARRQLRDLFLASLSRPTHTMECRSPRGRKKLAFAPGFLST